MPFHNPPLRDIVDTVFNGAPVTALPSVLYLSLWNAYWGTEASFTNYARVQIDLDGTDFSVASTGTISNSVVFAFPTYVAGSPGGDINYWALTGNSTLGNIDGLFVYGDVSGAPHTPVDGDIFKFAIGAFDIILQ